MIDLEGGLFWSSPASVSSLPKGYLLFKAVILK
jgi:hypothetical protein